MENKFNESLKETMEQEDVEDLVEKDYDKYLNLREEYFNKNKSVIIKEWFKFDEIKLEDYIKKEIYNLREMVRKKKKIAF